MTISCVVKFNGAPPDPVQPHPPDVNMVNILVFLLCVNASREENRINAIKQAILFIMVSLRVIHKSDIRYKLPKKSDICKSDWF
jgi:hypothetical protein